MEKVEKFLIQKSQLGNNIATLIAGNGFYIFTMGHLDSELGADDYIKLVKERSQDRANFQDLPGGYFCLLDGQKQSLGLSSIPYLTKAARENGISAMMKYAPIAEIVFDTEQKQKEMGDAIRPSHYGGEENPYETIKVIEAWNLGFNLGNVVKYVARAGKKDPTKELEDLQKAATYLEFQIQKLKKNG